MLGWERGDDMRWNISKCQLLIGIICPSKAFIFYVIANGESLTVFKQWNDVIRGKLKRKKLAWGMDWSGMKSKIGKLTEPRVDIVWSKQGALDMRNSGESKCISKVGRLVRI